MVLPEPTTRRVSIHDGFEVGVVLKGGTEMWFEDFEASLEPGDVWMIAAWEPHEWRVRLPSTEQVGMVFLPEFIGEDVLGSSDWFSLFARSPAERPGIADLGAREAALRIGAELREELLNRPSGWATAVRLNVTRLLFTLSRRDPYRGTGRQSVWRGSHSFARIAPALELIHARPVARVTLTEAAANCGLSPAQFARIFRKTAGLSFGRFRLRAHLAYAAHLLSTTEQKTDAIAAEAGFVDGSHLHRNFVRQYGVTPGQYRGEQTAERERDGGSPTGRL